MPPETALSEPSAPKASHQHLWVIAAGIGVGALAAVLVFSEAAREVAFTTMRSLFGIVTTPFLLESTVALLALFIVLAINKHRLDKEGDGWVYMMVPDPEEKGGTPLPKAITQRLQGTVLKDKPEPLDEALAERSMVEGYLELGMAVEARREFQAQQDLPDDVATSALRVRVLASNLDTVQARELLAATAARFANQTALLSATAREQADWLRKHLPAHEDLARLWHAEAEALAAKVQPG
ncbi:hypothetical protein DES53_101186 [Roseimicrobium gellanilyticum]|uniref:Uncharacterized protein n=1 Tax=Roseimicrobium gellanilyticum TaxID=748857 RepID=A0A366HUN2_9BACT|nr:hypothetical protein [Roseimicrobium gellanilyticum]RBP47389.1 hypothetical protein DES53_101186 [Roseimicrobium gellanilyticum]